MDSTSPTSWPPPPLQLQFSAPPPPLFPDPDPSSGVDLSPLEFVLALVAVVTIPALVYTFCFSVKFPSNPLRRRGTLVPEEGRGEDREGSAAARPDFISGVVKFQKEAHAGEIGGECPVCLSAFGDGEEIKRLSHCKHSFHASCIDMWLASHTNCPICRASVGAAKRPSSINGASSASEDFHQGLPDAANLV